MVIRFEIIQFMQFSLKEINEDIWAAIVIEKNWLVTGNEMLRGRNYLLWLDKSLVDS